MHRPTHRVGFPFCGDWVAINTPAERIPSHGTDFFGQRYAYDFVRLNSAGSGFSSRSTLRQFVLYVEAADFTAWNEPVLAAFPGEVIASEDGWPDRRRINAVWEVIRAKVLQRRPKKDDLRPLLGNYLLIEGEPGVALYAHLKNSSLAVKQGQLVKQGQKVAAVGNSGNSTMPHLHFHVMDHRSPWDAQGVYCGFDKGSAETETFVPNLMQRFAAHPKLPSDA